TPQRRTALVSVVAACVLIALKLGTGLATGSLGLISEAVHSGTDLVAALLTLFAVGVAVRPADRAHAYGHGKAEHLAALAEGGVLVLASLFVAYRALARLTGFAESEVDPAWYAFVVVLIVIAVDASRTAVSLRAARRYQSPALQANALHFGSDLVGSAAVLVGLLVARAGYPQADSLAALFVAVLVLIAAGRLMRRNVDVLMDRMPVEAERAARRAIDTLDPAVQLRRLRMRQAAGRHFADVVIGVSADAAVGQAHAAADAVEAAVHDAVPGSDVVVHVEPVDEAELRERVHAAALSVPRVREVHNLRLLNVDGGLQVALHLKLPGELSLEEAHAVASSVEQAISAAVPEVDSVQTHLEPLREPGAGTAPAAADVQADTEAVRRVVREETGTEPRELRFLETDDGLVVFLTLGLDPDSRLADVHERASEIEERIRRACGGVADVIVHTEP
ncbi:MAG TPA: cation diffusion facilitator family transporter, partial [Gaiellaceae bacterium]|nr:cation diffusion facilitator family transporter [Gaiellaceae bacterium]